VGAHLLLDGGGGAEEEHPVQVHDQHARAHLLEQLLLGLDARHLGALELAGGRVEHA
jgi:hypothetical protein